MSSGLNLVREVPEGPGDDFLKFGLQYDRFGEGVYERSPLKQVVEQRYGRKRLELWRLMIESSTEWPTRLQMFDGKLLRHATLGRLLEAGGNEQSEVFQRVDRVCLDMCEMDRSDDWGHRQLWSNILLTRVEDLCASGEYAGAMCLLRERLIIEQKLSPNS